MQRKNRQWILHERPRGSINADTFILREQPIPELAEGEVLIKILYLSFDPAQRGWIDDIPSYMSPVQLGEPMRASGVGQIISSHNTSKTAYFGLLEVGCPQPGETVIVSGAGGATGSVVCQIAKLKGCRVIGIAGGGEKCHWLRDVCGIENVIDYKSESIEQRLSELCPQGANLFFDNVGGSVLETVIGHMADHGRIVLCGAISGYNDVEPAGPRNMFQLIARRIRMQGFIVSDHMHKGAQKFDEEFGAWIAEGRIAWREDIQEGFENIPATLRRLFEGRNQGKQLLKLADPE